MQIALGRLLTIEEERILLEMHLVEICLTIVNGCKIDRHGVIGQEAGQDNEMSDSFVLIPALRP